jgi:TPR repeat protein
VARDEVEALAWFQVAARGGDEDAARNSQIAAGRVGPLGVRAAQKRSAEITALIESQKKGK